MTTRPVDPWLKYSNWIVSVFLFVLGTRALLQLSVLVLNRGTDRKPEMPIIVGLAMATVSNIIEAVWAFQWKNIAWKIGVALCALYVVSQFLPGPTPNSQVEHFSVLAGATLVLVWFLLPKVKAQFHKKV